MLFLTGYSAFHLEILDLGHKRGKSGDEAPPPCFGACCAVKISRDEICSLKMERRINSKIDKCAAKVRDDAALLCCYVFIWALVTKEAIHRPG